MRQARNGNGEKRELLNVPDVSGGARIGLDNDFARARLSRWEAMKEARRGASGISRQLEGGRNIRQGQGFHPVVALYHDQGHIPLKLMGFDSRANVTIGLPIIRNSVDQGTAFDIAEKIKGKPEKW